MCDYSLTNVTSRPAKVDDKLQVKNFGTGTRGFAAPEDDTVAVCVLPGTELAFTDRIMHNPLGASDVSEFTTAIFRQVNLTQPHVHHDAMELPNGLVIMLNSLVEGQTATVLQLPAAPKTEAEKRAQKRVEYAG